MNNFVVIGHSGENYSIEIIDEKIKILKLIDECLDLSYGGLYKKKKNLNKKKEISCANFNFSRSTVISLNYSDNLLKQEEGKVVKELKKIFFSALIYMADVKIDENIFAISKNGIFSDEFLDVFLREVSPHPYGMPIFLYHLHNDLCAHDVIYINDLFILSKKENSLFFRKNIIDISDGVC